MTRSSEDIEREVEATRGSLDRTVEALKERMTPGQLVDEVMDAMGGPVQEMASNLGRQVRANPIPLALIGAGVAWLAFGRGHGERRSWRSSRDYEFEPDYAGAPESGYLGMDYDPNTVGQEGEGRLERVKNAARDRAGRARQAMSSARGAMSERADDARQRASQFADTARQRASEYGQRAREVYEEADPLLIGAIGVAVGAAIGAAIPATPIERRYVGPLRDRAWEEGRVRGRQAMDKAKHVAQATVDSVREEAHRQGVTNLAGLVDKAEQVARAGVDTAKREAQSPTH
ncbi:MAG: DUF3618 domain-containing protein [Parcubacteria group bacterium]